MAEAPTPTGLSAPSSLLACVFELRAPPPERLQLLGCRRRPSRPAFQLFSGKNGCEGRAQFSIKTRNVNESRLAVKKATNIE